MNVCPLWLLFKCHKGWTHSTGKPPPTRNVGGGNAGMNVHLSEVMSWVMEPVADILEGSSEVISNEHLKSLMDSLNEKHKNWRPEDPLTGDLASCREMQDAMYGTPTPLDNVCASNDDQPNVNGIGGEGSRAPQIKPITITPLQELGGHGKNDDSAIITHSEVSVLHGGKQIDVQYRNVTPDSPLHEECSRGKNNTNVLPQPKSTKSRAQKMREMRAAFNLKVKGDYKKLSDQDMKRQGFVSSKDVPNRLVQIFANYLYLF